MPQMFQVLREQSIDMLTAGMSTRAVDRELNVNLSTIRNLQCRFREFGQLMKLRSISVCNKALLWGKTCFHWLGLAPQWVGLAPLPSHVKSID